MSEDTYYGYNEAQGIPVMGEAAPVGAAPGKTKSRKLPLIIAIIAIVAVLAVAAVLIFTGIISFGGSASSSELTGISAKIDEDGNAYIPLLDGTCITIKDEVLSAGITADRKHVVVVLADGTLYVTDKNLSSKTQISTDCDHLSAIRNDGFIYWDTNDIAYRVVFEDNSSVELGHDVALIAAKNSISVLYATDEGGVFTLASNSTNSNKVGSYTSSIELEAISDDAQLSVWVTSENDNVQTIVLNDGEDREILGEVDYKYNYTYVNTTDDQGLWIITNLYSEYIWIKYPGQDTVKAKLGSDCYSSLVYGSTGLLSGMKAKDVDCVYVSTDADTGCNVYSITTDGDRERILSKIYSYRIIDDGIIYTDEDNSLYIAELDGTSIADESKIASDVDSFEVSENGKYVYYMRNCDDGVGALYCYKVGSSEPVKVASEVACSSYGSMYTTISADGASVFYFKDMEKIADTYTYQGTLMLWNYSKEEASKISSDVVNYSVSSGLSSGEVNPKGYLFMKYGSVTADGDILVNWMFSDGSDTTKMATDVIR